MSTTIRARPPAAGATLPRMSSRSSLGAAGVRITSNPSCSPAVATQAGTLAGGLPVAHGPDFTTAPP